MAIAESTISIRNEATRHSDAERLLGPIRALKKKLFFRAILLSLLSLLFVAFCASLAVMTVDAIWRWRTSAPRWIGSLSVLVLVTSTLVRVVARRSWSFSLVGLAKRLEELFPSHSQDLCYAVSIALTDPQDPLLGSSRLRASLMQRSMGLLARIDLNEVISSRPLRWRMGLCLCSILFMVVGTISSPSTMWQATRRLAAPWRVDPWPRQVILELQAPEKVARGADVTLVARSRTGVLPATATVVYSGDDGVEWSQPMHREENRFSLTIPKLKGSAWLRATGGDDDQMRWQRIEVVEPVSLTAVKLLVQPPKYTQLPPTKVSSEMTVLEGSKLQVELKASRSIRAATPKIAERTSPFLPTLRIDSSGRRASGEWTLDSSLANSGGKLRIDVHDAEGAWAPGAWNGVIKVIRDAPPVVEWREPKGSAKVQPQGRLALAARVTDDVRLSTIELRHRVLHAKGESSDSSNAWKIHSSITVPQETTEYSFGAVAELSELSLQVGDSLEWMLIAVDAKGQAKESEMIRCAIVEVAEVRKENDAAMERFLEQLAVVARKQRDLADSLREGAKEPNADAQMEQVQSRIMSSARAALFDEQAIGESLSNETSGLLASWRRLLEEQSSQRLLSEADEPLLEELTHDLETIATQDIPAAINALEGIQTDASSKDVLPNLNQAAEDAGVASIHIQAVIERLMHWRRWTRAAQSMEELLGAQEKLLVETRSAAPGLLGKLLEELTEEERRKLEDLAAKQAELGRQLEDLPPPPASNGENWRNAKGIADEEMRQAARDLTLNKLSQADSHQERALSAMRDLSKAGAAAANEGSPTDRPPSDSNRPAEGKKKGPTEAQLKEVIALQTGLRQRTKRALEALDNPGANKVALEAELVELATAQAELAKQVEAWQSAALDSRPKEERPRE